MDKLPQPQAASLAEVVVMSRQATASEYVPFESVAGEVLATYTINLIDGAAIPPQVAVDGWLSEILFCRQRRATSEPKADLRNTGTDKIRFNRAQSI